MSKPPISKPRNDYDSPWKEILEAYFEECMAFFFPDVHSDIDWSKGYEFLDKELQQVAREAEVGKRIADKLVKVWTKAGEQIWVLAHVEVQGQYEKLFAQRVYTYNYRLRDYFDRPVASFAILSDGSNSWRPEQFSDDLWGCTIDFKFRTAKLLDYREQWDELLSSNSPFAIVVMAHLKTLETAKDQVSRKQWKLKLLKLLYEKGYDRQDVVNLFRFIDWLLMLPTDLDNSVWTEIKAYQEKLKMPYVTSLERIAEARGREVGLEEGRVEEMKDGIEFALELKFGKKGIELASDFRGISDAETLRSLKADLRSDRTLDDLKEKYAPASQG